MTLRHRLALKFARTPLHRPLSVLAARLNQYMDASENLNEVRPEVNGEYFILDRAAQFWSVVLDVGANIGDWSLAVRRRNAGVTILAFEPSPKTFAVLASRVAQDSGMSANQCALSAVEGTSLLQDYGDSSGLSGFFSRQLSTGLVPLRAVEVKSTTVDRVIESGRLGKVDYVKIDTEGAEMEVLRGMRSSLANRLVSCVQFEYGGTWLDAGELLKNSVVFFGDIDWKVYRIMPQGVRPLQYAAREEHFKYANYLAVPDESVLATWTIPQL